MAEERQTQVSKGILCNLTWLRSGLKACNGFLSTLPSRLTIVNQDEYYDAAYSAMIAGTKTDKKRITKSLRNMIEALGNDKKEFNFYKFVRALIRIKRSGSLNWDNIRTSLKTESRQDRLWHHCRPVIIYIVPIASLIGSLILGLLG